MSETKFSFFKKCDSKTGLPDGLLSLSMFMDSVKSGTWKKEVEKVRDKRGTAQYKLFKSTLPAVTISGDFKSRDNSVPTGKRLKKHSGYICIDIDKKDNPKMRTKDLIDSEAIAEFISAGGEGKKVIYKCKAVSTVEEHRRIYDAVIKRLEAKHYTLKPDPIVKSVASLQYVTYDPEARYNPKTKLVVQPLPPIKRKKVEVTEDREEQLRQLDEYIDALGTIDVSKSYETWLLLMFGLSYSFGEAGRLAMHKLSKNYKNYSKYECDEKYDSCLENDYTHVEQPVSVATVFQLINDSLPKAKVKQLNKKYQPTHAVGKGEDVEQGDLAGLVRYKLMLFKKRVDKETKEVVELIPLELNLNEFERLLKQLGFFRYGDNKFVQVKSNIVEKVDVHDILRIVTDYVDADGDYAFTYDGTEFFFAQEEISYQWRKKRASGGMQNQVSVSLTHWIPNLLKDGIDTSYIPYRNGVLEVTGKTIQLLSYADMTQQIWRERILPRDYKQHKKPGMFEEFFANVMGRGSSFKDRIKSEQYKRAMWYYGYMLQGTKRLSTARAWILYDVRTGNNGRSGKTIIGNAIGHIRSMTVIDGKRADLTDKFTFQTINPWTNVVLIDDVSKGSSLEPVFNMITGKTMAERKNIDPIVKDDIKYMLTSNWFMEAGGSSEIGRQFVSQLDDFYIQYAIKHNNTITPIVDYHGKEFFTDWDENDWAQFDTFSVKCLQYHLSAKAPDNTIIGNAQMMRFIQMYEEELFFDLCLSLCQYVRRGVDGVSLMMPQQIMMQCMNDNNKDIKSNRAGRVVKEFFQCIGAPSVTMTTFAMGGTPKMAYKLDCKWGQLNFGSYSKHLPKPKEI